jgi:hypothetical protein
MRGATRVVENPAGIEGFQKVEIAGFSRLYRTIGFRIRAEVELRRRAAMRATIRELRGAPESAISPGGMASRDQRLPTLAWLYTHSREFVRPVRISNLRFQISNFNSADWVHEIPGTREVSLAIQGTRRGCATTGSKRWLRRTASSGRTSSSLLPSARQQPLRNSNSAVAWRGLGSVGSSKRFASK